jgi:hypothetical protein
MTLQEIINSTAQQLGISPQDLATVISYETAGTFDPLKAGPTTKWGQHRGLLQWGEPQAEKYGVDWKDLASQGRAMVNYFKDAGLKPGMGLMDIYSAVNAGRVGRYNASDEAAGGAPGTVADKVNDQMEGHKLKAQALLGRPTGPGAGMGSNRSPEAAFQQPSPAPAYDPLSSIGAPSQSPSQGPGEASTATPWDYISGNRDALGSAAQDFGGGLMEAGAAPSLDPSRITTRRMGDLASVEPTSYTRRRQPSIYDMIAQGGY